MVTDGRVHDIDKDDWDRWCEYIFYRGLYRTAYVRVSRSTITDTELQIGQFVLPKHGTSITNETTEGQYLRAWKEELSPGQVTCPRSRTIERHRFDSSAVVPAGILSGSWWPAWSLLSCVQHGA